MNLKRTAMIGLMSLGLMVGGVNAAQTSFSSKQKTDIESIVKNYLVKNPEILLEVSKSLQQKQQKDMQEQAASAIDSNGDTLFDHQSPVVGNQKGNVTLVEFFDYQCVHCKRMAPVISKLLKEDSNLRVVYKDFPIFGKGSSFAAKAAIAANMQGKYKALHDALLSKKQRLSPSIVLQTASSIGINTTKLKADMKSKAVKDVLKNNMKLAESLRLMGTPAFVVAYTPNGKFAHGNKSFFVPGAASEGALQSLIKEVQDKK